MSSAVHFTGIDNTVDAFIKKGIPYFAVVSGKQIIHKNQDETSVEAAAIELENFLNMLNNGSNAIYTLRIYETLENGKITDKTPCDYGLNFRLNIDSMTVGNSRLAYHENRNALLGTNNEILNKLSVMEARLQAMEEEDEEPEDMISGLIKNPEIQTMLMGMLTSFLKPTATGTVKPTAIAGISENKLSEALEILKQHDPHIDEDLMKLAEIAVNNPNQFQMLLKMLRNY